MGRKGGNNREYIFSKDEEKKLLISLLEEYRESTQGVVIDFISFDFYQRAIN